MSEEKAPSMRQIIIAELKSGTTDTDTIVKTVQSAYPKRDEKSIKASIFVHKSYLKKLNKK